MVFDEVSSDPKIRRLFVSKLILLSMIFAKMKKNLFLKSKTKLHRKKLKNDLSYCCGSTVTSIVRSLSLIYTIKFCCKNRNLLYLSWIFVVWPNDFQKLAQFLEKSSQNSCRSKKCWNDLINKAKISTLNCIWNLKIHTTNDVLRLLVGSRYINSSTFRFPQRTFRYFPLLW